MSKRTVAPAEDSNEGHRAFDGDPLLPVDERRVIAREKRKDDRLLPSSSRGRSGRVLFCEKIWGTARRKFSSPVRESEEMTLCCRCAGPRPVAPWRKIPDLHLVNRFLLYYPQE
ncbi:unnamed protein product [Calypogeia fissa]